jgi:tetratricopeptide (TPR) repeat protein
MNMLNKQIITIATVSFLWVAAVHIALAKKPAAGGGGNHMQRGIELAQQKHFDEAAAEFTKAIQANSKDPRGYANRGTAYRQGARAAAAAGDSEGASTRYQSALADCAKDIELAPKDASGYLDRGQTEYELKQYDTAVADLNKALELKPNDALALKLRGFARLRQKDYANAITDLTKAMELKPDPEAYRWRAEAYRDSKQYDLAVADYTAILSQSDPNASDQARLGAADLLAKRGYTYALALQYENAIADFQAALKLNPQDNDTLSRLQYAQSTLAKKNASPPPAASPSPTPTPEKPSLIASIKPLYVGIGIAALIIIAVIVRLLTRGKPEGTSSMIR